jgi:hypothetical protein
MYRERNWVLVGRHRIYYTQHGNQESRVIEEEKTGAKPR